MLPLLNISYVTLALLINWSYTGILNPWHLCIEGISNFNNRNTEMNTYKKEKLSMYLCKHSKFFLFQQLSLNQCSLLLTSKNGFQYISQCFDYRIYLSILTDFASLMIDKCTFTVVHFLFREKVTVSVNYVKYLGSLAKKSPIVFLCSVQNLLQTR